MQKPKQTSTTVASLAARVLADPKSSKRNKTLAGSALAQTAPPRKPKRSVQVA